MSASTTQKTKKRSPFLVAFIGLCILAVLGLCAIFAALTYVDNHYAAPQAGRASADVFEVPKGASLARIAQDLENQGFIDDAFIFKSVTQMRGNAANLRAGEYQIEPGASMAEIYDAIASGKAILYPVTIPEGLTSAQIMRIIEAVPTLTDDDPSIPAEGTLLPETYLTPRGMRQSELIAQMKQAQQDLLNELWEGRDPDLPVSNRADVITLASVIEKETGIGLERGKVAGVFINRLNRGIRLQSDPTIIYGLTQGEPLGRGIRRSEIDGFTEWNTYQIDGLPKTPICNPGADAIRATLNPEQTDALFFVADGTGGHAFAKTLAEHNANVKRWRQIERERKRHAGQGR